ncbi:MAG: hypothetical protein RBS68_14190 [Anaerolineales bacterium]|jgi:hypothetical protein|nr:hypothetical protein [Anaerolineales bacterium]
MIVAFLYRLLFRTPALLSATSSPVVGKNTLPSRGPKTDAECAEEWRELMAKQAREESELLAERLEM